MRNQEKMQSNYIDSVGQIVLALSCIKNTYIHLDKQATQLIHMP